MIDIVVIILAGLVGGIFARMLHQPLILGYILVGVLVGPHTGGATITDIANVEKLADIGVALLLFSLGLEFSKKDIRSIAGIALYGTLIQVALTIGCGYLIGCWVGWDIQCSLWFGLAIASSSTAVIMKTLISRGNMNTLSGKLMMGMSIVQDLSLIPLMILLIQFGKKGGMNFTSVAPPLVYAVGFVLVMHLFGSRVAPRLLRWIARWNSRELFSLSVVALGLGVGLISHYLGLSFAFGAFVAGMVLSDSDYGHRALSELVPLRDLFGLLFFVSIGMLLDPGFLVANAGMVIFLFLAATLSRGLILAGISWLFGYRRVVPIAMFFGMLAISEIAFVLIRMGLKEGALGEFEYSLILNTVAVSMVIGPVASGLTAPVYNFLKSRFGQSIRVKNLSFRQESYERHIIVVGEGGSSHDIGMVFRRLSIPYVIIEANHNEYRQLKRDHLNVIYGDPFSEMILNSAGIGRCKMLLLLMGDEQQRDGIVRFVHQAYPQVQIVARAETLEEMRDLKSKRDVEVIHPDFEAAFELARQVLIHFGVSPVDVQNYLVEVRKELYAEDIKKEDKAEALMKHLDRAANLLSSIWVVLPMGSAFAEQTLQALSIRSKYGVTVTGVIRGEKFTPNPAADFTLLSGDILAIIGKPAECQRLVEAMKKTVSDSEA